MTQFYAKDNQQRYILVLIVGMQTYDIRMDCVSIFIKAREREYVRVYADFVLCMSHLPFLWP